MTTTTQANFNDQTSIVKGNVAIVGGGYVSQVGRTAAAITTGGSKVLAAGISRSAGTADPLLAYSTSTGVITITPTALAQTGGWWAIVQL